MKNFMDLCEPVFGKKNGSMVSHLVYKKMVEFITNFDQFYDYMYIMSDAAYLDTPPVGLSGAECVSFIDNYKEDSVYVFVLSNVTVIDTIAIDNDVVKVKLLYHRLRADERAAVVNIPVDSILQMGHVTTGDHKNTEERFILNGCVTKTIKDDNKIMKLDGALNDSDTQVGGKKSVFSKLFSKTKSAEEAEKLDSVNVIPFPSKSDGED